jgi:hypothetical protein
LHTFHLENRITSLAFSPRGDLVVIGTASHKVLAFGLMPATLGKLIWQRDDDSPPQKR